MKIVIEYNGTAATCVVDGKHLYQCDALTKAIALQAFETIRQHLKREGGTPTDIANVHG